MCELAISVVEKTSDDPHVDCMLAKRGVVVEVFEDGHDYGRMELTHPMFRILKLPGAPASFGRSFMGKDYSTQTAAQKWAFKIDLDHPDVPADLKAHLADDSRAVSHFFTDMATLQALKTRRVVDHPFEIGPAANVIG